ncbi:MAG: hypothetical protein RBQ91_00820 [Acholeplasma sp.]|nr:hypothetical protein [Acholeplasma sp.]
MKKLYLFWILIISTILLVGCQKNETPVPDEVPIDVYQKLVLAETLSGMADMTKTVIRVSGNLGLPTEYDGVTITYTSRMPNIIDNNGIVTLPTTCWIESRNQQGGIEEAFIGLNDNWPVVLDVVLTFENQTRTAKLLFVVAPQEGYSCNKYLG